MGLPRSLIDVDYVSGRWCYVDGCDVGCRGGDFLSYCFMFFDLVLVFGFSDFYSFCLTVMVIFCFVFGTGLVSVPLQLATINKFSKYYAL